MSSLSGFTTPQSAASLQPTSLLSTESYERSIETDVHEFWSSFPCPPPWKPGLLFEVNVSRFDPLTSRTVRSFLAGKCDLHNALAGFERVNNLDSGDFNIKVDFRPTDTSDSRTPIGGQISHYEWCDSTCQLSFGCALFLVIAVMVVSLLVCISKNRARQKMVATRPSRQQLQLSTSTSDAANCTEFSNLEIQGEEVIFPPFRHRGLPNPPRTCHPSCDPTWNCQNCASSRPLMSPSHSEQYYSHTYSAVYESIDDTDDEVCRQEVQSAHQQGNGMPVISEHTDSAKNRAPRQMSPTLFNSAQVRPSAWSEARDFQKFAETKFNGDDQSGKIHTARLPNYFELEKNCAFSPPYENVSHAHKQVNFAVGTNSDNKQHEIGSIQHTQPQLPCEFPMLGDTPLHSFVISQAKHNAIPNASEFYKPKSAAETTTNSEHKDTNKDQHLISLSVLPPEFTRGHLDRSHIPLKEGQRRSGPKAPTEDSRQLKRYCQLHGQNAKIYNSHVCATASTFFPNIPSHYFCPNCQHNNVEPFANAQEAVPPPQELKKCTAQTGVKGCIAPDLINEASNYSRKVAIKNSYLDNKHCHRK